MSKILKTEKIADGVVLNDAQTSYNCRPVNLSGIVTDDSPIYYAIGSNAVAGGTFSGALNGALTEADLADSGRRINALAQLFPSTGAVATAKQLRNIEFSASIPEITPWQQVALSRASGAGTAITVDVWAVWREET
ncbi:hypothetical protein KKH18_06990 [bacterium]|nr:hypothetical protein [bacterium]